MASTVNDSSYLRSILQKSFLKKSDSDTEDHGTEIKDGYKGISTNSNGDPMGSAQRVTTEQANAMKAASHQTAQSIPPPLIPAQEKVTQDSPAKEQKKAQGETKKEGQKKSQGRTHSMKTRRSEDASRAGGLRPAVGPV
jgi:hypothetical protein